jgi:L-ascorbate metabolism protein UlaG (beta-lactamase superfamily)
MKLNGVKVTWLGHSTFVFETPGGKIILVDPWVMGNPSTPDDKKTFDKIDVILCTHGHGDHIGDGVALAKKYDCKVVGSYEVCLWMKKKGIEKISPMNKGGSQDVGEAWATMVQAEHSSGIEDGGEVLYGGEAAGYVIQFENGLRVYHAGDTNVFGDMQMIHEIYQPHIAFLPIGDLFTMGPREAAHACRLLKPRAVVPMHWGTFPVLTGTPQELERRINDMGIELITMKPGETIS